MENLKWSRLANVTWHTARQWKKIMRSAMKIRHQEQLWCIVMSIRAWVVHVIMGNEASTVGMEVWRSTVWEYYVYTCTVNNAVMILHSKYKGLMDAFINP